MPVGPEFQDPPPPNNTNYLPYFVVPQSDFPLYEQTVTLQGTQMFEAIVGDPNPGDTLSARWVANYPPVTTATKVLFEDPGGSRGTSPTWTFKLAVSCDMFMQGADHNLVVIASDNGFISPDSPDAPTTVSRSQIPYNFDKAAQPIATMTGWRISGCSP